VKRDDPLVLIDDELKKAAFDTAQAAFDKSSADWKRAQDLFAQKVISEAELQGSKLAYASAKYQLTSSKRDLENARVKAPISGVVTEKLVNEGEVLSRNAAVAHIVDAQHLKIQVQVGERDVLKVKEGMSVTIESDLYPGVTFHGRVAAVSPKGDSSLTFPVEIAFTSDPRAPLYDGMSAKVSVDLGERSIMAVPRISLVNSYLKPQVFVVRQGRVTLVDIVSGSEYGTDLEVLGGLAPEDLVVTSGQNNLTEGQRVEVIGGGA
jgi:RND family efflux transporter MFP subunit